MSKQKKERPSIVSFLPKFTVLTLMAFLLFRIEGVIAAVADAIDRPAIVSDLGAHSVLLSVTSVGDHFIAVGERGLILRSDDDGKSWRQLSSPVSVTLTGVSFLMIKMATSLVMVALCYVRQMGARIGKYS
ncbi:MULTISPECIES: hypothetical protein [Marinomonas]|uniref:Uncharacterized protein n=1 Tax=Marinomonas rhodophyticola TaxID=2992803 RepID=A0ABT3KB12_9GAMM|nr:hypothetical protein [Marinomonas sp. KJ51-3]MCW4627727.1 hypothetical protein [Marinomonas sp. KJ51-3]